MGQASRESRLAALKPDRVGRRRFNGVIALGEKDLPVCDVRNSSEQPPLSRHGLTSHSMQSRDVDASLLELIKRHLGAPGHGHSNGKGYLGSAVPELD